MKVKIIVELDVPDEKVKDFSKGEMAQLLFDAYVNYATCSHLQDSIEWCAKAGANSEDVVAKHIFEYHKLWGDICSNAKATYEY